jgi:hypothetical protein
MTAATEPIKDRAQARSLALRTLLSRGYVYQTTNLL